MSDKPVLDNQFHKDSINALKTLDPTLVMMFGFESTHYRSLAANILCLSGELENAIRIPKEPMLAAIRVQWWYDTLADTDTTHQDNVAPLVVRLHKHILNEDIKRDDILRLIEAWQTCALDETASSTDAWGLCWQLIGQYLGDDDTGKSAQNIAYFLHEKRTSSHAVMLTLDKSFFGTLRKQVQHNRQWWLYFAAIIGYHKHSDSHDILDQEHLLMWRLLRWRLFGFKLPD